uniref:Uncharacterized protein n=1 Tax=Physcomitrium patens TaxID=3218 RepID=A0A2K1JH54_PHYPA|nr:hypothetical protein PHYPA_018288 [Physcomitrium patens]
MTQLSHSRHEDPCLHVCACVCVCVFPNSRVPLECFSASMCSVALCPPANPKGTKSIAGSGCGLDCVLGWQNDGAWDGEKVQEGFCLQRRIRKPRGRMRMWSH